MPTPSKRLLKRLREELPDVPLPESAVLLRTFAGHWQRSSGAWSWYTVDANGLEANPHVGSPESIGFLLKAERLGARWTGVSIEIDVEA